VRGGETKKREVNKREIKIKKLRDELAPTVALPRS
jgi:hypothetical protein